MTELADPAAPVPHEEVRRYFESSGPGPALRTRDVGLLRRETHDQAMAVRGPLEPVAAVETLTIGQVPARLYRPAVPSPGAASPEGGEPGEGSEPGTGGRSVLVWLHGGGWIHGDLDCYEAVARAFANRAGCAVVAVDYRLAPEHPFPAGFDDAWAAVEWSAAAFDRVAVAGDSSGGNLAAATAIKARDANVPLAAQVLVYPVLESRADTEYKLAFRTRYASFAGRPDFGADSFENISYIWDRYVPDPAARDTPYASPSHAGSLRGTAPALIITAEHDILRREAQEYALRLRAERVPAMIRDYPGQIHGFFQMRGVMSAAQHAMDLAAAHLRCEFAR